MEHKKKTNWREQLKRYGVRVINNPLRYCRYDNSAVPYCEHYVYKLRYRLKRLWNQMYPDKQIML